MPDSGDDDLHRADRSVGGFGFDRSTFDRCFFLATILRSVVTRSFFAAAAVVALLVLATLMVLPTGLLTADFGAFFAAVFFAGSSASAFFTGVLRGAFFGASSTVVCEAARWRPVFFGAASSSSEAVRFDTRFAAPNLTSFSPQISSRR